MNPYLDINRMLQETIDYVSLRLKIMREKFNVTNLAQHYRLCFTQVENNA